jgi:hypothetical protein
MVHDDRVARGRSWLCSRQEGDDHTGTPCAPVTWPIMLIALEQTWARHSAMG